MYKRIEELKGKQFSWKSILYLIKKEYDVPENLTPNALRCRYDRYRAGKDVEQVDLKTDNVVGQGKRKTLQDGSIEAEKVIEYTQAIEGNQEDLLRYLGYNPAEWQIMYMHTSVWQQNSKKNGKTNLYAVKYRIKPLFSNEMSIEKYVEAAKTALSKEIKPRTIKYNKMNKKPQNDKLMELTGIELHLGKMAWRGDTGQDYDKDEARKRFRTIIDNVAKFQEQERCAKCLLCIGNDFFNSDTIDNTTTQGTPQMNDMRWQKLFILGLQMYVEAIKTLLPMFDTIEVRLQSGNHDKMASFYLYEALGCYFKDCDTINFSTNIKDVQCYVFGKCAIFFSHGTSMNKQKRLIASIPSEFYKEWGKTKYRELHLGHLHKEMTVDDNSGLITRRVGSPTGTDYWHYSERFIGATQKYQVFIWDKNTGLQSIRYINF